MTEEPLTSYLGSYLITAGIILGLGRVGMNDAATQQLSSGQWLREGTRSLNLALLHAILPWVPTSEVETGRRETWD